MSRNKGQHPIQVASRRSGVTQDVIRAWERRYHAVTPGRSETNRRLYSDEDVERLYLLRQVTQAGRRIGDVARLSLAELEAMLAEDRQATARVGHAPAATRPGSEPKRLAAALEAVSRLDTEKLEHVLAAAKIEMSRPRLMEHLVVPLLEEIGVRWRAGTLRVAHEHMASAMIRSFLGRLTDVQGLSEAAPELVVASPAGQRHEFGGLVAAATASADGWRVTYLGADLPAEEIVTACLQRKARAVALSITYPSDDPGLPDELRTIRAGIGESTPLVVGGAAAPSYAATLGEIGAVVLADMSAFGTQLTGFRRLS